MAALRQWRQFMSFAIATEPYPATNVGPMSSRLAAFSAGDSLWHMHGGAVTVLHPLGSEEGLAGPVLLTGDPFVMVVFPPR